MAAGSLDKCLEVGSFVEFLFEKPFVGGDEAIESELHQVFLSPIIASAVELRLYGPVTDPMLMRLAEAAATERGKNYFVLDVSKGLLGDYVRLWNAAFNRRGSIAVVMERGRGASALAPALERSFDGPGVWSSRAMLRRMHTASAITWIERTVDEQNAIACAFSRSNGCQWMDVFADRQTLTSLYLDACAKKPNSGDCRS